MDSFIPRSFPFKRRFPVLLETARLVILCAPFWRPGSVSKMLRTQRSTRR